LTPAQKDFQRTKMAIHAAMITRMDSEIGKVLGQLEAMGAARDTVIIFLSDNGASSEQLIRGDGHDRTAPPGSARTHLGLGPGWSSCSNSPFRLHKSWVNEGGISSPLIVHWPAGIKDQNKLRHDPCHFIDVLPTLVDLAGGAATGQDGVPLPGKSLAPAFQKDGAVTRDYLYFNHNKNRAIRSGDWKLIATGEKGPWELYDLSKDRCEQRDLAQVHPELAARLSALWKERDENFVKVREGWPATTRQRMGRAG
jgi:arylsulfatase